MRALRVSELTSEPVRWLWPGYLPLGKLVLLDGDPGLGKSLIALDLCARLSKGQPMPDGKPTPEPGNSLVLEAEDGPEDTVRPRLLALGADPDRVFVVRRGEGEALPCIPSRLDALESLVVQTQARLLVLAPILGLLDAKVNIGSDPSVRRALDPLDQMAKRQGCAVLMVRHLNKKASRALYRGGGSIGFQAEARISWLLAADPEAPGCRRGLAQIKNNCVPLQPSLSLEIGKDEQGNLKLTWPGQSALTADDLLGKKPQFEEPSLSQRARDFLLDFLHSGPRRTHAIWEAAVRAGLTRRTLQRASADLNIRSTWVREDGIPRAYWALPDQEVPGVEEDPNTLEPWLRPLREKYPPPSPLDETD